MKKNARIPKKSGKSAIKGPELWDECSAEKGVQLTAELDFKGAAAIFDNCRSNHSLEEFKKKEPAAAASMAASSYWAPLINPWLPQANKQAIEIPVHEFAILVDAYENYDFGMWLSRFKECLLELLINLATTLIQNLNNNEAHCPQELLRSLEKLPVFVLKTKKNAESKNKLSALFLTYKQRFPEDGKIALLLASSYYTNHQKKAAYQLYARILLYYPEMAGEVPVNGNPAILPPPVADLLQQGQAAKAVIIGVMLDLFPLIALPEAAELTFNDPDYNKGLICYRAFFHAEKALQNAASLKEVIKHRRRLFETDKQIGEKYMAYLRSTKRQPV